jgi:hypothetical protein
MATYGVNLGEKRDVGACVESLDCGPHPCAAGTDDEHVVLRFHVFGRYRMRSTLGFVAGAASAYGQRIRRSAEHRSRPRPPSA